MRYKKCPVRDAFTANAQAHQSMCGSADGHILYPDQYASELSLRLSSPPRVGSAEWPGPTGARLAQAVAAAHRIGLAVLAARFVATYAPRESEQVRGFEVRAVPAVAALADKANTVSAAIEAHGRTWAEAQAWVVKLHHLIPELQLHGLAADIGVTLPTPQPEAATVLPFKRSGAAMPVKA